MSSSPSNRVVMVTGASAGFGAAIARRFAADGDRVVVTARRMDNLTDLASELGPDVLPVPLDVRDRAAVSRAVATLPADFAAIDVLVNNAGLALGLEPAHEADLSDWEQMLDTNCRGLLFCTRAVLPGMVERRRGHVVNLGSIAATWPYPGGNVYGATKAFVHQLSLNLRADLHGTGVRVTCIEPGMSGGTRLQCSGDEVASTQGGRAGSGGGFSTVRFHGDQAQADRLYAGAEPLTPDDVAEAVHWAVAQPAHVNVNTIELMPVAQSFGPLPVHRQAPPPPAATS